MTNTKTLCISMSLLACLALGATWASAGPNDRKWWMSDRVKAEMTLSEQQSQDIEAIFQATVPRLRAQKEELDRLEKQVSELLSVSGLSEADFALAIDRAEAARGAINKSRLLMLFRMRQLLSPEQRATLKVIHQREEQARRERRPGSSSSSRPN